MCVSLCPRRRRECTRDERARSYIRSFNTRSLPHHPTHAINSSPYLFLFLRSQSEFVKLAKKVQHRQGASGSRAGGSGGAGSSGGGGRGGRAAGGGAGFRGSTAPPPDPNNGRGAATSKQKELVSKIQKTKDYYELFGVAKSATADEIKKAYRKLALQLHPDKNTAPGAEDAFMKVNKAWDILSDKSKRMTYDNFGEAAAEGRPGGSPFGGGGGNPFAGFGGGGFPGGGAGGFQGVPLEEILRQFQAQRMGGFGGAGAGGSGMPGGFNLKSLLSNLNPQMLMYSLPLLFMAFQALSSVFSLLVNYWYVLLILPLGGAVQVESTS